MLQILVSFHTNTDISLMTIFHYWLPLDFPFDFVPILCSEYSWYMAKHPPQHLPTKTSSHTHAHFTLHTHTLHIPISWYI